MGNFTFEEMNLMCIYNTGSRTGLIDRNDTPTRENLSVNFITKCLLRLRTHKSPWSDRFFRRMYGENSPEFARIFGAIPPILPPLGLDRAARRAILIPTPGGRGIAHTQAQ